MTALLLLVCVPIAMWLVQSILLRRHGLPIRWRLDAGNAPSAVRVAGRWTTQCALVAVILVYPAILGQTPLAYYAGLLPRTRSVLHFLDGAAAAMLFLCALYGVWLATGLLQIDIHHSRRKWIRRLAMLLPTAVFGAGIEELLFRGVVLADLLRSEFFPPWLAIGFGALVFAAAHYVRPVKRRWTFPGHLCLGLLLCVAFRRTGSLWLPMGLHAGGILMIMGARPFVRYRGPAWITGASIFPFAGLVGILALGVLAAFVSHRYGTP